MKIVASNSLTVSNVNDGTITHTAYAYSSDGTDRFTTTYPRFNLLDGTKDFSGDWTNSSSWENDGTYKGLTVKKKTVAWSGIYKIFTAPKDGVYTFSAYVKGLGSSANVTRFVEIWDIHGKKKWTSNSNALMGNNFDWLRDSYTETLKTGDTVWSRYEITGSGADSILWTAGHKWEQGSTATPYMPSASEATTADYPSYIGQYTDFTQADSTKSTDYTWSLIRGNDGKDGATGKNGVAGKDGVGIKTTVITYAISTSGTIAPNTGWTSSVPSLVKGQYLWTKTVWTYTDNTSETGYSVSYIAKDGNNGHDGFPGKDGVGISNTIIEYVGAVSGTSKPTGGWSTTIPTVPAGQYLWTRTTWQYTDGTSEQGYINALMGLTGASGRDGIAGKDGKGIKATAITYQASTNGTTAPTGTWSTSVPSVAKGSFLWTRTIWTYTDNTTETGYAVAYMGTNGNNGTNGIAGKDGTGIKTTTITYAVGTSGTTAPNTGWSTTIPTVPAGQYLWTRTTWQYTDGTSEQGYINALMGLTGASGRDGIAGKDGKGIKATAITYQASTNGTTAPTGTWSTSVPSVAKGSFLWTRTIWTYTDNTTETGYAVAYMGTNGNNGTNGIAGKDGTGIKTTTITYAVGTSGTTAPNTGWSTTIPTVPAGQYLWTRTTWQYTDGTSEQGYINALMGLTGASGRDGIAGKDGKGIKATAITYQASTNGTTAPTGTWSTSVPSVAKGSFLWTRTIWTYTDNTTETGYAVAYMGTNGNNGTNGIAGKDGVGIKTTVITYAISTSGTIAPNTGWTSSVPSLVKGQYLWTKTVWTYTDNTSETGYSVSYIAKDGNNGHDGFPGKDGVGISNTIIEYVGAVSGTSKPTGGWSTTIPTVPAGQYLWTRTTWQYTDGTSEQGYINALMGLTGASGRDGIAGKDGKGIKATAITYQASTNGTTAPTGTWSTSVPSVAKGSFLWTRTIWTYTDNTTETGYAVAYMGTNGNNGTNGIAGKDGTGIKTTTITYAVGTSGTTAPNTGWSTTIPTVPAGQYLWTRTTWQYTDGTSEQGYINALMGLTGASGRDGIAGKDGKGIKATAITYQASTNGTTAPTGTWSTSVPSVAKGSFLWTRTIWTYTDNTTETGYAVAYMGTNGNNGTNGIAGKDGVGIKTTVITYAISTSGTIAPNTGWTSSVPSLVKGQYLWTKTVWTYTDNTSETGYSVSYIAKDGNNGHDGFPGKDGVGISNTIIEYVGAVSGTSKPTGGWSTTIPTVPAGQYLWTRTTWQYTDGTSEQGYINALMGLTGASGRDGIAGKDGKGIKATAITYQASTNGTTAPTGTWSTSVPSVAKGSFLWTRTIWTYTDNTTETGYAVAYMGTNGNNGTNGIAGKDGVGIKTTVITYAISTSGTIAPNTGWTSSVPSLVKGQYLWTKTVWTYTDNTSETGYSVSYIAKDGNNGHDGFPGKDGVGIKTTTITYAGSTSGTTAPNTGWSTTIPTVPAGQYLWTKTLWTYTDNSSETGYSVAKMGNNGTTGPQGPPGSNGAPGKIVSNTEPTTRFKGLTWKYSGTSDLKASDGTVIHPNTEYYYNGTHWMINYLSANNIEANSIKADKIDAKNLTITDGEFVSTTTNGPVTTSTEIKDNHIAISKTDGTVNTKNDLAVDTEQGFAMKFTNNTTGLTREASVNFQGVSTSDSNGNYAQLTPQGTKLSTDVPWTDITRASGVGTSGTLRARINNGVFYAQSKDVTIPSIAPNSLITIGTISSKFSGVSGFDTLGLLYSPGQLSVASVTVGNDGKINIGNPNPTTMSGKVIQFSINIPLG
ncbi:hypothetical protein LL229_03425 [Lactococcus lactis subsp. lactis]|uniref:Uncharacterized protein n=1 Tax=Lactococcus lactis subsp. lactis TaxID=1360 RepID=A0AAF0W3B5_LACLL|nr:hypothetical protein [Lactococcus lactis]WNS48434.1 hypothetical protein LL229_03425 [Lactococcus lactis subsp. lactis]